MSDTLYVSNNILSKSNITTYPFLSSKPTASESQNPVQSSEEYPLAYDVQLHEFLLEQLPGAQLHYAFKAQLCYRVPQTGNLTEPPLRWSQIFTIMERAKTMHSNIVDYSICEATLEEVLLRFVQSDSTHTCKVCEA